MAGLVVRRQVLEVRPVQSAGFKYLPKQQVNSSTVPQKDKMRTLQVLALLALSTLTSALPTAEIDVSSDLTNVTRRIPIRSDPSTSFYSSPFDPADDPSSVSDELPSIYSRNVTLWDRDAGTAPPKNEPSKVYCKDFHDFRDDTSDASPLLSDCMAIIPNIAAPEHSGTWKFMIGRHRKILWGGDTCVFAVQAPNASPKGSWIKVGNSDVVQALDIMRKMRKKSLGRKLEDGDKLGGVVETTCKVTVIHKEVPVEFQVYHT